jgi:glucokinase
VWSTRPGPSWANPARKPSQPRARTEEAGIEVKALGGIGIGAPGAIDHERGVVLEAVNLRWTDFPLAEVMTDHFKLPVVLDNDVNVAVFGEWKLGAGRGVTELLGVWLGTGVGGGLILNNALYQGAFHTAGEIGHTILFPGGALGTRSLEQNCSRTAIAERLLRLIRSNHPSSLAKEVIEDGAVLKSKLIAAAYDQGDSLTREVVDEAARLLGTSIAGIVTVLSLPRVVLGGGLTEALGKPFVSSVKKAVRAEVFPHRLRDVEVVGTTLEDDAGLLGAALLARERLAK